MSASGSLALSNFFISQDEADWSCLSLGDLEKVPPAYRAMMVCDGTLTHMLSALHLERIVTTCDEIAEEVPDAERRRWLEIGEVRCLRRDISLVGALSGQPYVRARSYLVAPRLPASFLDELSRPGGSLGTQLLRSKVSNRRELIWARKGSASLQFSRLYRILVRDQPAILIQEDFLEETASPGDTPDSPSILSHPASAKNL